VRRSSNHFYAESKLFAASARARRTRKGFARSHSGTFSAAPTTFFIRTFNHPDFKSRYERAVGQQLLREATNEIVSDRNHRRGNGYRHQSHPSRQRIGFHLERKGISVVNLILKSGVCYHVYLIELKHL
jgi:hypothetical protein